MFPSHRPKVYRSRLGCCICGAKSSSSRFTSSVKYETLFAGCFGVNEKRHGEICNACVLLVKRWQKLPSSSAKNWKHVLDSKTSVKRTTKSRTSSRSESLENEDQVAASRNGKGRIDNDRNSVESQDDIDVDLGCLSPSLTCGSPSPSPSDISDECSSGSLAPSKKVEQVSTACQTAFLYPTLTSSANDKLPYIDLSKWRREEICCGMIFRGPCGEVLVDPKLLNPLCTCSCSSKPITSHMIK